MSYIVIEMKLPNGDIALCKDSPEFGSKVKLFTSRGEAQELASNCQDGIVVSLNVETPEDIIKGLIRRYQDSGLSNEEVLCEMELLVAESRYYGADPWSK